MLFSCCQSYKYSRGTCVVYSEAWLCISFMWETPRFNKLRHGIEVRTGTVVWRHVELLWFSCEARGLSKQRHGITVSTGTVVWNTGILRGTCVQYQSYMGDDACRTHRDTVGFTWTKIDASALISRRPSMLKRYAMTISVFFVIKHDFNYFNV